MELGRSDADGENVCTFLQTASSVALPGPASRVRINCSSDLVLAQCGSHVVIIHVMCGPQG